MGVEAGEVFGADAAGHGWGVVDVGLGDHGFHGRGRVAAGEFEGGVGVPDCFEEVGTRREGGKAGVKACQGAGPGEAGFRCGG